MKKIKIIKEIFIFFKKIMHHFIARLVNSFKNSHFLWFQRDFSHLIEIVYKFKSI
jgi:hypothetical protein